MYQLSLAGNLNRSAEEEDIDTGTVGEWLFDETSGNRASNFAGGPDLALKGTIPTRTNGSDVAAVFNNAATSWLSSTDSGFNFAANADTSFTISVVAESDAATGSTQTIFSKYDNDIDEKQWTIDVSNSTGNFFARVSVDGDNHIAVNPPDGQLGYGNIQRLDMRFTDNLDSTGTLEVRVNGDNWASAAIVGDLYDNAATFTMAGGIHDSNASGTGGDKKNNFDGAIYYLRVWDVAKTDAEIDANWVDAGYSS